MKNLFILKNLLVVLLFLGIGCQKMEEDHSYTLGTTTTFRINQPYASSDKLYSLLINDVTDSRCPEGVECFWSGEVVLKGTWTSNGITSDIELHSVMKSLQKEPQGFSIQIVDAKPYPKAGIESNPEDLVITLLIQKN